MTCVTAPLDLNCLSDAQPEQRERRQASVNMRENIYVRISFVLDAVEEYKDLTRSGLPNDLTYVVNPDFAAFHPRVRDFRPMWPIHDSQIEIKVSLILQY